MSAKTTTTEKTKKSAEERGLESLPWKLADGAGYLICFRDGEDESACLAELDGRKLGGHYLGIAPRCDAESPEAAIFRRLTAHQAGRGARITQVAVERGLTLQVTRTWEAFSRGQERRIKSGGHFANLCPRCKEAARLEANAKRRARRAARTPEQKAQAAAKAKARREAKAALSLEAMDTDGDYQVAIFNETDWDADF